MSFEGLDVERSFAEKKSLVTKYRVLMKEAEDEDSPSQKKTYILFQVFEELIEHFGVFKEIMSEIRDELIEAVFSTQITSSTNMKEKYLCRVPFFVLIKRLERKRDESFGELHNQVETLQRRLFEKHQQYETALKGVDDIRKEMTGLQEQNNSLQEVITQKNKVIEDLKMEMKREKGDFERKEKKLNLDIQDLKNKLEIVTAERDSLIPYKEGYDKMQNAFQLSETEKMMLRETKKKPVIATRRANLISDVKAARKLEEQLLVVQNMAIEEFDKALEVHRRLICAEKSATSGIASSFDVKQEQETADLDLMSMQTRFSENVDEINTELGALRVHCTMLEEELQKLEEMTQDTAEPEEHIKIIRELGHAKDNSPEENMNNDPFVATERVFSKYSCMMFTSSNNCKSFHEFKDAKFCTSCGDKTLVCAHKIGKGAKVFPLPLNATHIKITRPRVRINHEIVEEALEPEEKEEEEGLEHETFGASAHRKRSSGARLSLTRNLATPSSEASEESTMDSRMKYTFSRIWDDYKGRCTTDRRFPRPIDEARLISIIEQFWATILWDDNFALSDEAHNCITEKMYEIFEERYISQEISMLAMHDFLSALLPAISSSKVLKVFGHVLVNNFDGTVFRYLLMVFDFVDRVEWKTMEDFRVFINIMYPFLNEDDVETMHIGYVSHSENKISKEKIVDYILYMLLKYREPRFLEMESRLGQAPQQEAGFMVEREFFDIMENILLAPDEKQVHRLFHEAEMAAIKDDVKEGFVAVPKLAQVGSYLTLLQNYDQLKHDLKKEIEKARSPPGGVSKADDDEFDRRDSAYEDARAEKAFRGDLQWTLTKMRNLGDNISRSLDFRQDLMTGNAKE